MSTEVTPESLHAHAKWMRERDRLTTAAALDFEAKTLKHLQRPLPTEPGWYPSIVVERGGESCTGALLGVESLWTTQRPLNGASHHKHGKYGVTIRWAEQDGTTPGLALYEAWSKPSAFFPWDKTSSGVRDRYERAANAVLAAHGTSTLTPVGENPEPGTRGLLPVVQEGGEWCSRELGMFLCTAGSAASRAILANPRPDGAHE